jgi:hypothetical protein
VVGSVEDVVEVDVVGCVVDVVVEVLVDVVGCVVDVVVEVLVDVDVLVEVDVDDVDVDEVDVDDVDVDEVDVDELVELVLDDVLLELELEELELVEPLPGSHGTGAVVVVVLLHGGRVSLPKRRAPTARSPRTSPTASTHITPAACWAGVGGQGNAAASVASTPEVVQPGIVVVVVGVPLLL